MSERLPTVREARYQLAHALLAEGSQSEPALKLLDEALRDPGTSPPDSRLYGSMAEAHLAFGDPTAALAAWLNAIASDPDGSTEAVTSADAILERFPTAAEGLPKDLIDRFEEALTTASGDASWHLAGNVRLKRMDLVEAAAHFAKASEGYGRLDIARVLLALGRSPEVITVLSVEAGRAAPGSAEQREEALVLARALAETGQYEAALHTLPSGRPPFEESTDHLVVRALSLLADGRHDEALRVASGADPSGDLALLRAIINLRAGRPDEARSEILAAAAANPSANEVLVLRAQIELETSGDLDEGRELLDRARQLAGDEQLVSTRWIALQRPFGTGQPNFDFFLAVATDVCGDAEALDLAEAVDRTKTTYAQDGTLDEIRGRFHLRAGRVDLAAGAFDQASVNNETASLMGPAREAARRAWELGPTAERAARYVRSLWQATYPDTTREGNLADLRTAVEVLDAGTYTESVEDAELLMYYDGLVYARQAELAPEGRVDSGWRGVTCLMAATMSDLGNAYRTLYLSEALAAVEMLASAVAFARHSFEMHADDITRERLVIAEANYRADPMSIMPPLDGGWENEESYRAWGDSVRAYIAFVNGDPGILARSPAEWDGTWARQINAQAVALTRDMSAARPLIVDAQRELVYSPGEECDLAYFSLLLGDIDAASAAIARGRDTHNVSGPGPEWIEALIAAVSGADDAVERGVAALREQPPRSVKGARNIQLPILRSIWPGVTALAELQSAAESELVRRASHPEPTVFDGLELAPPEIRDLLLALATGFEATRGERYLEPALERLGALDVAGRMGVVVNAALGRMQETPA